MQRHCMDGWLDGCRVGVGQGLWVTRHSGREGGGRLHCLRPLSAASRLPRPPWGDTSRQMQHCCKEQQGAVPCCALVHDVDWLVSVDAA